MITKLYRQRFTSNKLQGLPRVLHAIATPRNIIEKPFRIVRNQAEKENLPDCQRPSRKRKPSGLIDSQVGGAHPTRSVRHHLIDSFLIS